MTTLGLLDAVDRLYEQVVTDPQAWSDEDISEWVDEVAAGVSSRPQAKLVARCARVADRLRRYWQDPPTSVAAADWRSRVDIAVGVPAWRPTLDLARLGLDDEPSDQMYEQVAARFRLVHSQPFMGGIGYEEWAAQRGSDRETLR